MSAEKEWSPVTTPEQARQHIDRLVERFARNLDVYTRADCKETQVRVEFVDPFFEALGWDVRNVRGYAEQYKDVVHEDAIKVSGATRAPDYCFRVGGAHFFLEPARRSRLWKGRGDECRTREVLSNLAGTPGRGRAGQGTGTAP